MKRTGTQRNEKKSTKKATTLYVHFNLQFTPPTMNNIWPVTELEGPSHMSRLQSGHLRWRPAPETLLPNPA